MNYYPVYYITLATLSNSQLVLKVNGTPTIAEHSHFVAWDLPIGKRVIVNA